MSDNKKTVDLSDWDDYSPTKTEASAPDLSDWDDHVEVAPEAKQELPLDEATSGLVKASAIYAGQKGLEKARDVLPGMAEDLAYEAIGGDTQLSRNKDFKDLNTKKLPVNRQPLVKPRDVGRTALDNDLLGSERVENVGKIRFDRGQVIDDFAQDFDSRFKDAVDVKEFDKRFRDAVKSIKGSTPEVRRQVELLTKGLYDDVNTKIALKDFEAFKESIGDITKSEKLSNQIKAIAKRVQKQLAEETVDKMSPGAGSQFKKIKNDYANIDEAQDLIEASFKRNGKVPGPIRAVTETIGESIAAPFKAVGVGKRYLPGGFKLPEGKELEAFAARGLDKLDTGISKVEDLAGKLPAPVKTLGKAAYKGLPLVGVLASYNEAKADGLSTENAIKQAAVTEGIESLPVVGQIAQVISPEKIEGGAFEKERRLIEDFKATKQPKLNGKSLDDKQLTDLTSLIRNKSALNSQTNPSSETLISLKIADDVEKALKASPREKSAILHNIFSQPAYRKIINDYMSKPDTAK